MIADLSWWAVLVAAVVYFALGGFWFARPFFGRAWEAAQGFERPEGFRLTPSYYVVPLVGSLVVAAVLGLALDWFGAGSVMDALLVGGAVGCATAAVTLTNAIVPRFARPIVFGVITGGYHLIAAVLAAVVIFLLSGV
jgi:Protein of unknown function (DUF1761)